MEGVTDFATRLWMAQTAAPDEATTPFLRVTKDYPSKRISANFLPDIELSKEHGVVACVPQLMASETPDLIRIGEYFLKSVPFIDINCGCPSPTVVGHGAGSSLLQSPEKFHRYLSEVVSALGGEHVSVKMRVGFLDEGEFPALLDVLRSFPLARLTIHGRTRTDRYRGLARWAHMDLASRQLACPVVGSGDVLSLESFDEKMKEAPCLAGVIVGRGALRNPWLFRQLRQGKDRVVVSRSLVKARMLQFVLLQELQQQHWESFFKTVRDGFFNLGNELSGSEAEERNELLAAKIFNGVERECLAAVLWPVSRVSLARGKMLWNYLRSGLNAPPELSVAILRAPDWLTFLNALDAFLEHLSAEDVAVGYHREWDWVYSGAGSTIQDSREIT